MARGFYTYHNRYTSCPVCRRNDADCRTNQQNRITHCRGCHQWENVTGYRYVKDDAHGFGMWAPVDAHLEATGDPSPQASRRAAPKPVDLHPSHPVRPDGEPYTKGNIEFRAVERDARPMTPEEAAVLAAIFDGSPSALPDWRFVERDRGYSANNTHLGWESGYAVYEYGNLSRSGSGVVKVGPVAVHVRTTDATIPTWMAAAMEARGEDASKHVKRSYGSPNAEGAARGHILPRFGGHKRAHDFAPRPDVVFVEGATDAFALDAFGIDAVGRPNNRSGADQFAEIAPYVIDDMAGRRFTVLGENDRKDNGTWPGRTGAMLYGRDVAELLEPANGVRVGMVPEPFKDAREYIRHLWDGKDTLESRTRAADAFLRGIRGEGLGHVMRPGRLTPPEEAAGHKIPTFGRPARRDADAEVAADAVSGPIADAAARILTEGRAAGVAITVRADAGGTVYRLGGDAFVPRSLLEVEAVPEPSAEVQALYRESREQREREEALARDAAAEIAALRASREAPFRCGSPRAIPTQLNTRTGAKRCPVGRCQKWTCPGCRCFLIQRELIRLRLHIGRYPALHLAFAPFAAWKAVRKRLHRAKVLYHRVRDEGRGGYHLTLTAAVSGLTQYRTLTPSEAIDHVREILEAYTGDVNPCSASDAWAYPKSEPTGWERMKDVPCLPVSVDLNKVRKVAAKYDHNVEVQHRPGDGGSSITRVVIITPNDVARYAGPDGIMLMRDEARRMMTEIADRHLGVYVRDCDDTDDVCDDLHEYAERALRTGPRHLIC